MSGADADAGGDLLRLRRGVGLIYVLAGLANWAEIGLALLASSGRLPFSISPRLWSQLFFGHFLLLVVSGLLYLTISYYVSGLFTYLALMDYLVGVPVFMIALPAILGLVIHGAPAALAFLPGGFLLAYGFGLRRGRAMGFFQPRSL